MMKFLFGVVLALGLLLIGRASGEQLALPPKSTQEHFAQQLAPPSKSTQERFAQQLALPSKSTQEHFAQQLAPPPKSTQEHFAQQLALPSKSTQERFAQQAGPEALGQHEHSRHPPEDEAIHREFYKTWMRPNIPDSSCCNDDDCFPTPFKNVGDSWYALRRGRAGLVPGDWAKIPPGILEQNQPSPRESPDGRSHVCMREYTENQYWIICATLGSGT